MVGRGLHMAAERGVRMSKGEIEASGVGIGEIIRECVSDSLNGINQQNTIFGTLLLYIPLVIGTAASINSIGLYSADDVRKWIAVVLDNTTVEDTIEVYRAFHIAQPGGELNKEEASWTESHDRFAIDNPRVFENIQEDKMKLQQLFAMSAEVDPICKEWAEYYQLVLQEVFPYLDTHSRGLEDLEEGIVRTFVWLLSRYPDGLIVKKAGAKKAEEVRLLAEKVMSESRGDQKGEEMMALLDSELRKEGNTLNPGTTADLVSAAIFCKLAAIGFQET
jgi:triphosphoribosyl-dephospho-CoA synthase